MEPPAAKPFRSDAASVTLRAPATAAAADEHAAQPLLGPTSPAGGTATRDTSTDHGEDDDTFYYLDGELSPAWQDERQREDGRRFDGKLSSCCMRADHPLRAQCIELVCDPNLDALVLVVILINSIDMLLEPVGGVSASPGGASGGAHASVVEWGCMVVFSIELIVRIIAHGLIGHNGAFLHDAWNVLDVSVVIPFWVHVFVPDAPALGALRILRALRPLRAVHSAPTLRRTVVAFINSIPKLSTVGGLTAAFILVCGVLGVELFAGALRTRCVPDSAPGDASDGRYQEYLWHELETLQYCTLPDEDDVAGGGEHAFGDGQLSSCAAGFVCRRMPTNPVATASFGSFDNFLDAALVLLQAMTFNEWTIPKCVSRDLLPSMTFHGPP